MESENVLRAQYHSPESIVPDTVVTAPSLVRVARESDVDDLYRLALSGGTGLTNLPPDRDALAAKLAASDRAIASADARESGNAIWLIVEVDGRVVATSCIFPRVGTEWPFYSYRLTRQVFAVAGCWPSQSPDTFEPRQRL